MKDSMERVYLMKSGIFTTRLLQALWSVIFLSLASCVPTKPTAIIIPSITPTSIATVGPALTPSPIPTYPIDVIRDKLPATPPIRGFVMLDMPESVNWDDMITVTILTIPGSDCRIWYWGTSGLSHAAGLESKIADANGICSWTWKQATALGKSAGSLPLKAKISIIAGNGWGDYYLTVK
jgi:hypothetical protein